MVLRTVFDDREVDAVLAGVCGLYCGACPVYRAWVGQDPRQIEMLAGMRGVPTDQLLCTGCRAPGAFCLGGVCDIKACAMSRGVAFCADCADFPCQRIERLAASEPHRIVVFQNGARIREGGWYSWLREQDARWRCPRCHGKIGALDKSCPSCEESLGVP